MLINLSNKKALVTGGTHGIGLSTARLLLKAGCSVAVLGRTLERLSSFLEEFSDYPNRILARNCDVLDKCQIKDTCDFIKREWGGIDILVNNVGGGGRWGSENVLSTPQGIWEDVYQKNVGAQIFFSNFFLPGMIQNKWGRIITVSSIFGKEAGGRPWFNVAKAAQIALIKNYSKNSNFSSNGITFNTVSPGILFIKGTGIENQFTSATDLGELAYLFPNKRLGTAEEVANVILFLSSNEASLVNGANIPVDGGQSDGY